MASVTDLFARLEATAPASLKTDGWYIAAAASLIACHRSAQVGDLYKYLTQQPAFQTVEQRKRLSKRLRDVLLKVWTIVGIPLVIEAVIALAKAEKPEDSDEQFHQKPYQLDEPIEARGTHFLQTIYQHNLAPIFAQFGAHAATFDWLEKKVIYGLFLSDFAVLDAIETELVVVPGMLCQGLRSPSLWHLRGLKRVGVSLEDVAKVVEGIKMVGEWAGLSTAGWPRAEDITDKDV